MHTGRTGTSKKTASVIVAVTLIGLAFCLWNILAKDSVPCLTLGCAVQDDFTVAGVSLWHAGSAAFILLALCALAGRARLGCALAALMLGCDCLLLILMTISAPCLNCLFIALLLAVLFILFCRLASFPHRRRAVLLYLWGACFLMASGQIVHDLVRPWAIAEPTHAAAGQQRIFFSPSCSACRQLLLNMPVQEAASVFWCPVAERPEDIAAIAVMQQALLRGSSLFDALLAAQNTPSPSRLEQLRLMPLQLRLWINRGHVLRGGRDALPYIPLYGLPRMDAAPSAPIPPSSVPRTDQPEPDLPFLHLETLGECSRESAVPCP